MLRHIKTLVAGVLAGTILVTATPTLAEDTKTLVSKITVNIGGKDTELTLLSYNGQVYAPIGSILSTLETIVNWEEIELNTQEIPTTNDDEANESDLDSENTDKVYDVSEWKQVLEDWSAFIEEYTEISNRYEADDSPANYGAYMGAYTEYFDWIGIMIEFMSDLQEYDKTAYYEFYATYFDVLSKIGEDVTE